MEIGGSWEKGERSCVRVCVCARACVYVCIFECLNFFGKVPPLIMRWPWLLDDHLTRISRPLRPLCCLWFVFSGGVYACACVSVCVVVVSKKGLGLLSGHWFVEALLAEPFWHLWTVNLQRKDAENTAQLKQKRWVCCSVGRLVSVGHRGFCCLTCTT